MMESTQFVGFDEKKYCNEVLLLSEEEERSQEQTLVEEARNLGLEIPEVDIIASLAASIASGIIDLSSPILSSGSSTDRNSVCDVTPSNGTPPFDRIASSFSEFTLSSDPAKRSSTRSIASLSTRPTSYSSSEGRLPPATDGFAWRSPGHRDSVLSVASSEKKERRRSTLKSAIDKFHFRKWRAPSAVLLPPAAQITVAKGERGGDKYYLESTINKPQDNDSVHEPSRVLKLEIPVFDNESLERSLESTDLKQMRESHQRERNRHMTFQDAFLSQLRHNHQSIVADLLTANKRSEGQKREKNIADATHMEERQLSVEMDQVREFERAKMNSRTRIKYMEGYFNNTSPPPSPGSGSGSDKAPLARTFTSQQKAQLAQEYHDHDSMDRLHEAKIKVLRDRQELRLQEAIARMEQELDHLIDQHALEFATLQRNHQTEEASALQDFDARKTRLCHRWNLEEAIMRQRLEMQHGQPYGPLPPLPFCDSRYETRDSAISVSDESAIHASGDEEQVHRKRGEPLL
ncbi:hypothetical protein BDV28DRAFT_57955 [Aspergillus coremiiformis]|uniref:Uncharacterized protein n=1 Tax=Aspergillus coremiiformis TaxID=138285 RepID=A0A5N6ZG69_9EURO|nr:hypothetical protein BDV28DRAFT_57955 [Aspergillus coremiiformis]